jgi:uncharacterized glyoxalase superfamily protein PhnB
MSATAGPVPEGFHTVTPQLTLDNAAQTIEWYKRAFGAEEVRRSVGPDGRILHAELKIGDSHVMMNDVMGGKGPQACGGSPASFWLYVPDSDSLFHRAVDAGATVQMAFGDQFWGDRGGAVADPEGFTWWIVTRQEDLSPSEIRRRMMELFQEMPGPA